MTTRIVLPFLFLPAWLLAADATSVDRTAMDPSVNPCVDFYQYACGNWMASHPLPPDQPRYGRFAELTDRNEKVLLDLVETAAVDRPGRAAADQKTGDYFASCMDIAAIDRKSAAAVKPELDRIRALRALPDLAAEVARLHNLNVSGLFAFGSRADAKDSNRTIASLSQGGLSLPDRDYYLKTDAKSVETRARFEQHMRNLFTLAGDSGEQAAAEAQEVLAVETKLAEASSDRVSMRVPEKNYHIFTRAELAGLAPAFGWDAYFRDVNAPAFDSLNVGQPDFIKQLGAVLTAEPIGTWKSYLSYHWLREAAPRLPDAWEKEEFDFYNGYLGGAKGQRPRAHRCLVDVDNQLGDLLGQKYVDSAFGAEAKSRIDQLVTALESALEQDIQTLPWMTEATRAQAIAKLHAITRNVGFPRKWRDYSKVSVARDDYFGNWMRAAEAAHERRLDKIGKPTDKSEWTNMTPPTVNAFYSPPTNSINFPAGILQWPFFDPNRDMAVNFGAIGTVIGHEMTHGFDDSGRKYDGDGNLRDWWTTADAAEFERRSACFANEYSGFTSVDDVKLNGRLTLGENTADNGGVRVALMALHAALHGDSGTVDGFTPDQRLFLGFAQVFCENRSPEQARLRALTDPHSPGRFRINGTVQNMPEFQKAFSCKAGQPMVSANACRVW